MATQILPMEQIHSAQIARLHQSFLSTPYRGRIGIELLRIYYVSLTKSTGGVGFVAITNGQISGYICGVWNPRPIYIELLRNHVLSFVLLIIVHSIIYPGLVGLRVWRFLKHLNFMDHNLGPQSRDADVDPDYELRPIVVNPYFRGTGIAELLLKRLQIDARDRGYLDVELVCEKGNAAANAFYQKHGFKQLGHHSRYGQEYIRYRLRLNG